MYLSINNGTSKPTYRYGSLLAVTFIVWSVWTLQGTVACPPGCTCTTIKAKDGKNTEGSPNVRGRRVSCSKNKPAITSVDQISSLPLDTVVL